MEFQQEVRCAGEGGHSIWNTNICSAEIQHRFDQCHWTEVLETTQIEKSTCNPPSTGQYWEYSSLDIKGVGRCDKDTNSIRLCTCSTMVTTYLRVAVRHFPTPPPARGSLLRKTIKHEVRCVLGSVWTTLRMLSLVLRQCMPSTRQQT